MKNRLFLKVFVGYVFILIFILGIISSTIMVRYNKIIADNKIEQNSIAISKVTTIIEQYNTKLGQIVNHIHQQVLNGNILENRKENDNYYSLIKNRMEWEQGITQTIQFNQLQKDIVGILVYENDDNYHYMGDRGIKKNIKISSEQWYQELIKTRENKTVVGPYFQEHLEYDYMKKAPEDQAMFYIKKINLGNRSKENQPFIMLTIRYNELMGNIQDFFESDKQGILILDQENETVYSSNVDAEISSAIKKNIRLPIPDSAQKLELNKKEYLLSQQYIKEFGWKIICVNDIEEILAGTDQISKRSFHLLLFAGLIAFSISLILTYYIVTPIKNISYLMKKVQKGNFDVRVEVTSKDEIGELALGFNEMVQEIKVLIDQVYVSKVKETQASIEALQAQINPHFLYNTLENISSIAQIEEVDMIADISQSLATMFRYSIEGSSQYANFKDELEHVRNYMTIINIRFDGKIKYIEEVDPNILEYRIIKLFLQPLVENAVQHGIYGRTSCKGNIWVSIKEVDDKLFVQVKDDGVGISKERLAQINDTLHAQEGDQVSNEMGIGLKNVYQRCILNFGPSATFKIHSIENEETTISIEIPSSTHNH